MLSETFVTSIRAQKSTNTAVTKDVGIHLHTLHPNHAVDATFKKSSTAANCLAINSSHIFAAQAEKAVIHVYSRERSNQEALMSFPERIHSITLVGESVLALGTAEGRIILWEVCTGRQIFTQASHLQPVSCLAATTSHLITGSEDSNVHVWSIPSLLSLANTKENHEPIQTLSNHRAAITSVVVGHSVGNYNIVLSTSKDNTCIVWNYHTGSLLRTFLLPSTPLCALLEPSDRAAYLGFEDGTIQSIEFFSNKSIVNSLYDTTLQSVPLQVDSGPWEAKQAEAAGSINCMSLSYDGTSLLSGHASGKVLKWDTGNKSFLAEVIDLFAPVTNLHVISPFPETLSIKSVNVVKPRMGENNYTVIGKLLGNMGSSSFQEALKSPGIPADMLERAIQEFSRPQIAGSEEEKLRKENEELWKAVNEQRALQKRTYEKYQKAKAENNNIKA